MELEYVSLDIETTGIHPLETELVSCVFGDFAQIQTAHINETDLLRNIATYIKTLNKSTTTIITFMGGTMYSPGFDWPYLRTKFLKHGIAWPFKGFNHIDLYPIIQKWFDTTYSTLATFDTMNFDQLKQLAKAYGVKAGTGKDVTKGRILEMITAEEISSYITTQNITIESTHNGLKDCCMNFMGIKDFGVDGKMVPGMFAKWKETGDNSIIDTILEYNQDDCIKTMKLFDAIKPLVSNRILSGELL